MAIVEEIGIETPATLQEPLVINGVTRKDRFGNFKFGSEVSIKVQWMNVRSLGLDSEGNTIGVDAVAIVDRDIAEGSLLYLDSNTTDKYQVDKFSSVPDVKGINLRRSVGLMRYKES